MTRSTQKQPLQEEISSNKAPPTSLRKPSTTNSETAEFDKNNYRKGSEVRDEDLPMHLRRQPSTIFKVLRPPSNLKSVYARVLKAIGVDDI